MPSATVEFGTIKDIRAKDVSINTYQQQVDSLGTGSALERAQRRGQQPAGIFDLSGGAIAASNDILDVRAFGNTYVYNPGGVVSRIPGIAVLPELVTNQASITSDVDISGYRAANLRRHACLTAAGSSTGELYYEAFGTILYRVNATTGAYEVAATFTNNVTCMFEVSVNGTRGLAVCTDGATDDVKYTTDPTAGVPSWTTLVALSAGDYISAARFYRTLGNGVTIMIGKIGGTNQVWWMDNATAAPWTMKPVVLSETATADTALGALSFSSNVFAGAGANDATVGTTAWTTPGNITADDAAVAVATAIASDGSTSQSLKASAFNFTADAIPATATIEGVLVTLGDTTRGAGETLADWDIHLALSGVQVGLVKRIDLAWETIATNRYYGSFTDPWFAGLHGSDLANLEIWVRVVNIDDAATATASIDYIKAQVAYRTSGQPRTFIGPRSPSTVEGGAAAVWANILAAIQDDSSYAFKTTEASAETLFFGGFFNSGEVPVTAEIEHIVVKVKRSQTSAAINGVDVVAQLYLNGAAIGADLDYGIEIGGNSVNEETHYYFFTPIGNSTTFNAYLTGADLPDLFFAYDATGVTTAAAELRLNSVAMYVSYREKGQSTSFGAGGWGMEQQPTLPLRMSLAGPRADQLTTYTSQREMWHLDFSWDTAGQRPVVDISQPYEGVLNVHHAASVAGGIALTGSLTPGLGTELLFIAANGQLFDAHFLKAYGTFTPKINAIIGLGNWAALQVVMHNSAGTVVDLQWWFWRPDRPTLFWADTPLTSLTDNGAANMAIAVAPLACSIALVNPVTQYIYAVFPNSLDTAVRRERIHADLSVDPRLDNPSWVKQQAFGSGTENVTAKVRRPRLNYGPEDALKTITVIQSLSVQLDDNTSYGSVTLNIATDGDTTLASPEITNVFNTSMETYNVPGGIQYVSMIEELGLGHEAGSAETPNALPLLYTTIQAWPKITYYDVLLDVDAMAVEDFIALSTRIDTLEATKIVQRFRAANIDVQAVCEGWPDGQPVVTLPHFGQNITAVNWRKRDGSVGRPILRFRKVPGANS